MKIKSQINKAGGPQTGQGSKIFRLEDMDPEFVALVGAGANRQKSFMVVKADDQTEGAGDAPPTADQETTPGVENDNGPSADSEEPAAQKEDADESADGEETNGDGTPPKDTVDLSSWLEEAEEQVSDLSLDHAVQAALDAQAEKEATAEGSDEDEAEEIEPTEPPPVEKVGEEGQDSGDRDSRLAELEEKLDRTQKQLSAAKRANTSLKAKNARLSKGVGQSSVMLTGEVTTDKQRSDSQKTGPSKGAFLSGGDIAAAVD